MAFSEIEQKRIEKPVKAYIDGRRPPPHVRNELDLGYRIRNQSVELFETRPAWQRPGEYIEHSIAKATFVKADRRWKIYWLRKDLRWHRYEPDPSVSTIEEFLAVVEQDQFGCFYG